MTPASAYFIAGLTVDRCSKIVELMTEGEPRQALTILDEPVLDIIGEIDWGELRDCLVILRAHRPK